MYKCNYCGRILKQEHEKCPGCGGSSFETKMDIGENIIKEPPKGGYKINTIIYEDALKKAKKIIIAGVCTILSPVIIFGIVLLLIVLVAFTESSLVSLLLSFFVLLLFSSFLIIIIGIGLVIFGVHCRKKMKNQIERIKNLARKGWLVKNMPYTVKDGRIKVVFKNSNGVDIPLLSALEYDIKMSRERDKTVDLLIDPNDYSNYFIDYKII